MRYLGAKRRARASANNSLTSLFLAQLTPSLQKEFLLQRRPLGQAAAPERWGRVIGNETSTHTNTIYFALLTPQISNYTIIRNYSPSLDFIFFTLDLYSARESSAPPCVSLPHSPSLSLLGSRSRFTRNRAHLLPCTRHHLKIALPKLSDPTDSHTLSSLHEAARPTKRDLKNPFCDRHGFREFETQAFAPLRFLSLSLARSLSP